MPNQPTAMRAASSRVGKRAKDAADSAAAQLAAEIRRYCDLHPYARDSIDGIAWWLTWQRFSKTRKSLQGAIDQLVAGGVLEPHRLTDGSVVFGCAKGCAPVKGVKSRRIPSRRKPAVGARRLRES